MTGSHRYRSPAGKGLEYRIDYSHVSDALFRCDAVRLTALNTLEQMLKLQAAINALASAAVWESGFSHNIVLTRPDSAIRMATAG